MATSRRPWFICTEVIELTTDFLEVALPPADRLRFRLHLVHCRYCRRFVKQMRLTAQLCHSLGQASSSELPLPPRLQAHFRALQRTRGKEKP